MEEALIGALVDVSGSMTSAYTLDKSTDASVERTHAILTTIMNIVKQETVRHHRQESIFICAFGLDNQKCGHTCCDFMPLIDLLRSYRSPRPECGLMETHVEYRALIDLMSKHGAPQAEIWVRNHLLPFEAKMFYKGLFQNKQLTLEVAQLISLEETTKLLSEDFFEMSTQEGDYKSLISLLKMHRAPEATEQWIRYHLSVFEVNILYMKFSENKTLIRDVIRLIPNEMPQSVTGLTEVSSWFDVPVPNNGHHELTKLAELHNAPHASYWIINHLSPLQAQLLYIGLCQDRDLIPKFIPLLPSEEQTTRVNRAQSVVRGWDEFSNTSVFGFRPFAIMHVVTPNSCKPGPLTAKINEKVSNSEVYMFAQKIIRDICSKLVLQISVKGVIMDSNLQNQLTVKAVKEVSQSLDDLLKDCPSHSSVSDQTRRLDTYDHLQLRKPPLLDVATSPHFTPSQSLHDRIHESIELIKPFILGGTPMCKALTDARAAFQKYKKNNKHILFILSDGDSADGDPRPICEELQCMGVTIVTCFLTSDNIENPKCLLYEPDPNWRSRDGRSVLFEMSSTMPNTHTPISYLTDANWTLPAAGESRLFVQANSLDVVDEFCKIVVSQMTEPCDALVDILQKVDFATYINQNNAAFKLKDKQQPGTCYAAAIATVFHLAMHRIVGREGGIPAYNDVYKCVIDKYGTEGAHTVKVLVKVCPDYRLHFKQVDETGARQAINQRRPVVATFFLYDHEWDWFIYFYENTPGGVLKASDLKDEGKVEAHAVVLTGCAPKYLTFMNNWGEKFGLGGFFRVEDKNVLHNMKFYDVYWTKDDLKPSEREAFKREGTERGKELLQQFPSVKELPYECPTCNRKSKVEEFSGHILEAECPKCHQKFKPTNKDILQSLYCRAHDL